MIMYFRFEENGMVAIKKSNGEVFCIPNAPLNRDYVEYQEWLAEGNMPDEMPVIEQPTPPPTIEERLKATELIVSMLIDEE